MFPHIETVDHRRFCHEIHIDSTAPGAKAHKYPEYTLLPARKNFLTGKMAEKVRGWDLPALHNTKYPPKIQDYKRKAELCIGRETPKSVARRNSFFSEFWEKSQRHQVTERLIHSARSPAEPLVSYRCKRSRLMALEDIKTVERLPEYNFNDFEQL